MRQTWRWFGPADRAGTGDMMRAGVEGGRGIAFGFEVVKSRHCSVG